MDMDYIYAPTTVTVEFDVEPGINNFETLSLLSSVDDLSGLNSWVEETRRAMSPELRARHDMVMNSVYSCVRPMVSQPDFQSYINWIAGEDATEMRDRTIGWMLEHADKDLPAIDAHTLISDRDAYLKRLEHHYNHKHAEKGSVFDPTLYEMIHPYFSDPAALKQLIISHMQMMWDQIVKPEWERKLPLLQESVDAYRQHDYHNLTGLEAVRAVTGRDMSHVDWWKLGEHLIFVPSPHIGPYLTLHSTEDEKTNWVSFGVRLPAGTRTRSNEMSRSELNTRLSALADDTRLRVLELVMQHGELCAQDIITMLDLSQSAASRNLRQLTATGYLIERRRETAKCYSLNRERIDDTMKALRRFFRAK